VCSNFLTIAYLTGPAGRFKRLSLDKSLKTASFRSSRSAPG
jgi:hypothetical protein